MSQMDLFRLINSRGLPKTGQTTSYVDEDDGFFQKGWWFGRLKADNKPRFIQKTINSDVVVIDRATGLMWAADGNEAGCNNGIKAGQNTQITYAVSLIFAGFNNWRVPNLFELLSICDYERYNPVVPEPPFSNTQIYRYWSSSTLKQGTTNGWSVIMSTGDTGYASKATKYYLRCVRDLF